jgi:streptogramin lyase
LHSARHELLSATVLTTAFHREEPLTSSDKRRNQDIEYILTTVSTEGGGLNRFDPDTDALSRYRNIPNKNNSLCHDFVTQIVQDASGALWIGTANGLDRLEPSTGRFTHYRHEPNKADSLRHPQVDSVAVDRAGMIWLVAGASLDRLDPKTGQFVHYRVSPSADTQSPDPIRKIFTERGGKTLWLGYASGGLVSRLAREN